MLCVTLLVCDIKQSKVDCMKQTYINQQVQTVFDVYALQPQSSVRSGPYFVEKILIQLYLKNHYRAVALTSHYENKGMLIVRTELLCHCWSWKR